MAKRITGEPGVKRMFVLVCVLYAVPPVISRPPLSSRVTEGDTASFDCSFAGTPFPHTRIGWLSKQRPIDVSFINYLYNKYCEYFGGYVCAVFMNSDT